MNIEQKAKAYDEKLYIARCLIADPNVSDSDKFYIKDLFPEVIESEDERIRKELITWLQNTEGQVLPIDRYKAALAWLEKQGKFDKIVEKAKTEKQRVLVTESDGSANIDWDTRSLEDARKLLECGLQYINTELEKQGEQKPTIKYVYPKFRIGDVIVPIKPNGSFVPVRVKAISDGSYYCAADKNNAFLSLPIREENEYRLAEQKPTEWSEEDEKIIHNIDAAIRHEVMFPMDKLKSMKIWLESLKYRIYPKHEWKRDEKMFQLIEDVIDVYRKTQGSVIGGVHTEELKDYLKSLRPQNRWKPSEEQMDAIRRARSFVVDDFGEHPTLSEILMELEEQLKKLIE